MIYNACFEQTAANDSHRPVFFKVLSVFRGYAMNRMTAIRRRFSKDNPLPLIWVASAMMTPEINTTRRNCCKGTGEPTNQRAELNDHAHKPEVIK